MIHRMICPRKPIDLLKCAFHKHLVCTFNPCIKHTWINLFITLAPSHPTKGSLYGMMLCFYTSQSTAVLISLSKIQVQDKLFEGRTKGKLPQTKTKVSMKNTFLPFTSSHYDTDSNLPVDISTIYDHIMTKADTR